MNMTEYFILQLIESSSADNRKGRQQDAGADQPPTVPKKYSTTQQGRRELAHCSKNCQGRYSKSEVMVIASHQLYVTCHILWSSGWFQQQSPVNKDSVKRHYVAYAWLSGGLIKWDHLCLIKMECRCPSDSCETIIMSLLDILFEILS